MAAAPTSLKEYLKKYQSDPDDQTKKKKKKKKDKSRAHPIPAGVLVVDEDPVWQKPIIIEEEESADDEMPQVDEDIEVKRMRRLEAVRVRNTVIAEDGSGWVAISDQPKASGRADGDSDLSPPRQRRPRFDTPSPASEQDVDDPKDAPLRQPKVEADLSPPRQRRRNLDTPLREPKMEVDGDLSPPRRAPQQLPDSRRRGSSAVDLPPPRRRMEPSLAKDEDLSPQRKRQVQNSEDLSPPRKRQAPSGAKESRRTGLLSAAEHKIERKKDEETSRLALADPSLNRKGAEVVFRDKKGRRIKKEELLKAQEEEKPKEMKLEWGKGLAQKREAEARMKELELEKEKPFARTRDDPDLDKMLKEMVRWGDPMAHLAKKNSETVLEDLGTDEKMKESGFIIPQSIPSHSWIKRGIDFVPNRYGIRPGRHWDGVDRSIGYEKELFKRQNDKRATEAEAYLWSVADM